MPAEFVSLIMNEWINQTLQAPGLNFPVLLALLLLGIFTAAVSACNIAVIGAITGYAGAGESGRRRDSVVAALGFMAGSVLAMALIGAGIGYAGKVVGESFGRYGRIVAGLMLVFLGLMSLNLLPFKLPAFKRFRGRDVRGLPGTALFGFVLGGSSAACCLSCCTPALPLLLGMIGLQGQVLKGAVLMAIFGLGFSLPLTAILLGASLGKWALRASKAMPIVRFIAGLVLLAVGFYFLATI